MPARSIPVRGPAWGGGRGHSVLRGRPALTVIRGGLTHVSWERRSRQMRFREALVGSGTHSVIAKSMRKSRARGRAGAAWAAMRPASPQHLSVDSHAWRMLREEWFSPSVQRLLSKTAPGLPPWAELGEELPHCRENVVTAVEEEIVAGVDLHDLAPRRLRGKAVTGGCPPRRVGPLLLVPDGVDGQRGCGDLGVGVSERVQGLNERCERRVGKLVHH